MRFGSETYRLGALERLDDAGTLFKAEQYVGAMYIAGLALEGILRSLIWLGDKKFDERHDLREIAKRVEQLGLLRKGTRDEDFVADVQGIVRFWSNRLRFAGTDQVLRWVNQVDPQMTKPNRSLRKVSRVQCEQCFRVFTRCEWLWQRHRRKK